MIPSMMCYLVFIDLVISRYQNQDFSSSYWVIAGFSIRRPLQPRTQTLLILISTWVSLEQTPMVSRNLKQEMEEGSLTFSLYTLTPVLPEAEVTASS